MTGVFQVVVVPRDVDVVSGTVVAVDADPDGRDSLGGDGGGGTVERLGATVDAGPSDPSVVVSVDGDVVG